MANNISVSDIIPASPERVYTAWLDASQHGEMTGSHATDEGDGRFTAWDGYISGHTVSAEPHSEIVQMWRTTEFPEGAADSAVTITFEAAEGGTRVTINQSLIPAGQSDAYKSGWDEYYFTPMKRYFGGGGTTLEKMKVSVEEALEEAQQTAEDTLKSLKQAQKQAIAAIKKVTAQVGKKAKSIVAKAKKKVAKPAPKKKKKVVAAKKKKKTVAKKKKKK